MSGNMSDDRHALSHGKRGRSDDTQYPYKRPRELDYRRSGEVGAAYPLRDTTQFMVGSSTISEIELPMLKYSEPTTTARCARGAFRRGGPWLKSAQA